MTSKVIEQAQLSDECWSVQMWGLDHCNTCEFKGKRSCGGRKIRKTGKNELGIEIGKLGIEIGRTDGHTRVLQARDLEERSEE